MNAAVCACGLRLESDTWDGDVLFRSLITGGHDPAECSRQVGYQGRFDGRREMAEAAVAHLVERQTLGGRELAEIRSVLLGYVTALPLARGPVE